MGAWIETTNQSSPLCCLKSHPVWVRGLKHFNVAVVRAMTMSHPVWVRGLKQY